MSFEEDVRAWIEETAAANRGMDAEDAADLVAEEVRERLAERLAADGYDPEVVLESVRSRVEGGHVTVSWWAPDFGPWADRRDRYDPGTPPV